MKQFTPKRYSQSQVAKIILTLPDLPPELHPLPILNLTIWKNPLNKESLHLSHQGWLLANKLKMTMYKFELPSAFTPKQLLELERYLAGPYHVYHKGLRLAVLDESDSVMLNLQKDNIPGYLDNLSKYS